jgi:pimeloyl-ACP methyl ester carboxylesterase
MNMSDLAPLDQAVLPAGIRSRFVDDVNGLRVHIIEAGFEERGRPCVLLLHGFPELAWSWRRVMGPLAAAGFHVVAPDLRGYGRTTGWNADYDSEADLRSFRLLNAVRDALGLVGALGHRSVAAVVGHDFGSPVAAWCALVRPDVFRSVALMSAPFAGPPALPRPATGPDIHAAMLPWRSWTGRASTTSGTTRRGRPMPTCGIAGRACTRFCAPTTTTRAPTGGRTGHSG